MQDENSIDDEVWVRKSTENGQITLPKEIRSSRYYRIEQEDDEIRLTPIDLE